MRSSPLQPAHQAGSGIAGHSALLPQDTRNKVAATLHACKAVCRRQGKTEENRMDGRKGSEEGGGTWTIESACTLYRFCAVLCALCRFCDASAEGGDMDIRHRERRQRQWTHRGWEVNVYSVSSAVPVLTPPGPCHCLRSTGVHCLRYMWVRLWVCIRSCR